MILPGARAYKTRGPDTPPEADFVIRAEDDSLEPWIKKGGLIPAAAGTLPEPGELGIFEVRGRFVCRQYAEDILGTVYLFAPNRARRELDITAPPGEPVTCYGRVILKDRVPLPGVGGP